MKRCGEMMRPAVVADKQFDRLQKMRQIAEREGIKIDVDAQMHRTLGPEMTADGVPRGRDADRAAGSQELGDEERCICRHAAELH